MKLNFFRLRMTQISSATCNIKSNTKQNAKIETVATIYNIYYLYMINKTNINPMHKSG